MQHRKAHLALATGAHKQSQAIKMRPKIAISMTALQLPADTHCVTLNDRASLHCRTVLSMHAGHHAAFVPTTPHMAVGVAPINGVVAEDNAEV
jgi:hypothetical protein